MLSPTMATDLPLGFRVVYTRPHGQEWTSLVTREEVAGPTKARGVVMGPMTMRYSGQTAEDDRYGSVFVILDPRPDGDWDAAASAARMQADAAFRVDHPNAVIL
jgi:hypothetical protein